MPPKLLAALLLIPFLAACSGPVRPAADTDATAVSGKNWKAVRTAPGVWLVSLATGSDVSATLTDFCRARDIGSGSISGIGAVERATLRFFDPDTKKFEDRTFAEQMEVTGLAGNVARKDGAVYLHLHVTLGRGDFGAIAGHLLEARLRGAGEFYVTEGRYVAERKFDTATGLNLYDLPCDPAASGSAGR